jgi:hypothetical protein
VADSLPGSGAEGRKPAGDVTGKAASGKRTAGKLPGSNGMADRQLKCLVGRPYGGFVVRPDQLSDGVPRRRQVGKGQASASPRGDELQGGRLGGASQGAGCLRQGAADRSAVRAEGATVRAQARAEALEGKTSEGEARLVARSRSRTHARQAVEV